MAGLPSIPLPAYALYGENELSHPVDRLHAESIAERSRLHDWEIRPHRHAGLFQLLVVARGQVEARLDGRHAVLEGPALVTVPALVAHGFRFARDVDGAVFTVDERHLRGLLAADAGLHDSVLQPRAWHVAGAADLLVSMTALRDELAGHARWRAVAVDAALLRLLVVVARSAPAGLPADPGLPGRALAHLQRYRSVLEARFREQPSLGQMAGPLGITPTQLNRVCRQLLGQSALGLLHARLLLEAQRELAYTGMSVKQVALGLGFGDAAYFARFFQRRTGQTPSSWRAQRQSGSSLDGGRPK
jgi:AraC family transcriptional regulator, transcriptional activator of pobA